MASTYSPLKIELITTGEQSATWGTTTNINLGTAIEEAIVGSADVTFSSANVTLTLTDTNGTQAARNLRLRLTGTTGGARNLIVPAIEKFYIVQNDTADTITIKNSTGTGVAIPTSMTALVYNDGTNITSASVYSTSVVTPLLAATDASFVNALPIASGGTGTTTTPTGTGAYVRATSPTLVTPALGTPTSGTLTNCTGYTYANLAGTVPTWNQNTTGNAATATVLQTARNIGGVSFNGSADINLPGVNTSGNQNTSGNAATATLAATATNALACSGNSATATTATNVSGTVAVANGGTGVTSSTGTGSVVLSTSPTITGTVVIGTASVTLLETSTVTVGRATGQGTSVVNLNTGAGSFGSIKTTNISTNGFGDDTVNIGRTSAVDGLTTINIGTQQRTSNLTSINIGTGATGGNVYTTIGSSIGGSLTTINGSTLINNDATINGLQIGRGSGNNSTNTAVGSAALNGNTSGGNNTALGYVALNDNTTGTNNTGCGNQSLLAVTTGSVNTALGSNSAGQLTTGDCNLSLGVASMLNATTGSANLVFGGQSAPGTYAAVFDVTTQNNRVVMGHTSVTNAYVQVAWTVVSDARDKTNFKPIPHGLDFVTKLKPVAYQFRINRESEETNGGVRYGFKAQDILELEGDSPVIIDVEDQNKLKYQGESLVPVLVKAIQELKAEFDAYKATHP